MPQEALAALTERLRQPEVEEQDVTQCIEVLHSLYEDRFARRYVTEDRALRERVESALEKGQQLEL